MRLLEDVTHPEETTPIKTWPARASLKPSIPSSFGKRKVALGAIDKSNLPNCHNPKKLKMDPSNTIKTPFIELNPPNLEAPIVDTPLINQDIGPSVSPTAMPTINESMTLLKSETLAWHKFNQAMKTEDVSICYDMSMREFEHSTIHDLFKVHKYIFLFLLNKYMLVQALTVYVSSYVQVYGCVHTS